MVQGLGLHASKKKEREREILEPQTLAAQRVGLGSEMENTRALRQRKRVQGPKTSAHRLCSAESRPRELNEERASPATQREGSAGGGKPHSRHGNAEGLVRERRKDPHAPYPVSSSHQGRVGQGNRAPPVMPGTSRALAAARQAESATLKQLWRQTCLTLPSQKDCPKTY